MRVCERIFSVSFSPGLDSMSPVRRRRSASHVAGIQGWHPKTHKKLGGRNRGIQFTQSPRLWRTNHVQDVSVW